MYALGETLLTGHAKQHTSIVYISQHSETLNCFDMIYLDPEKANGQEGHCIVYRQSIIHLLLLRYLSFLNVE